MRYLKYSDDMSIPSTTCNRKTIIKNVQWTRFALVTFIRSLILKIMDFFFKYATIFWSSNKIFTESAHWADSVSKSRCPCVMCATFCGFFTCLITPIYKDRKSNRPMAKRFLRKNFRNYIGLRFSIFGSEMVKNCHVKKKKVLHLSLPLIVDGSRSQSAAASYCA